MPDSELLGMPPLDLGETMTMGNAPPQSAPNPRARAKEFAPLLALLPIVAAKAGPSGIAALLHGFQQSRQQRQLTDRQSRLDAERQQQTAETNRLRQAQAIQTATNQREAARRELLRDVQAAAGRIDSADAVRSLLPLYAARAQAVGLPIADVEAFVMESLTPTVLQQRAAQRALERAHKQYGAQASQFAITMPGEDAPVPYAELQRRAGFVRSPSAAAVAGTTYADVFPETRTLPVGAQAVPTTESGAINMDVATRVLQRMGVIARPSRSARSRPSTTDTKQRTATLDEETAFLLRSAARGQSPADARQRWARLAREYNALGIPFDARRDSIRVRVERELRGGAGDLDSVFDDALDRAPDDAPMPSAAPPAAPATPLKTGVVYRFENGRLVPKR